MNGDRRPLASAEEISEYLKVPVVTLHQWRHKGTGPRASKVGRWLRYRWEDVEEWLATAPATPRVEPGRFLPLLTMALAAEARGWGPDVTEITLTCPDELCTWVCTYQDSVTIGEMIERVAAHEHQYAGNQP